MDQSHSLSDRSVGRLDAPPLPLHLQQTGATHNPNLSMLPRADSEKSIPSSAGSTAPTPPRSRSSSFTRSKRFLTGEGLSAHEELGIINAELFYAQSNALSFLAASNMLQNALYSSPNGKTPPPPPKSSMPPLVLPYIPTPPPPPPSGWSPGPRNPSLSPKNPRRLNITSPTSYSTPTSPLIPSRHLISPPSTTTRVRGMMQRYPIDQTSSEQDKRKLPSVSRTWHSAINKPTEKTPVKEKDSQQSISPSTGFAAKLARFSGAFNDIPTKENEQLNRRRTLSPSTDVSPSIAEKIRRFEKDPRKPGKLQIYDGTDENRNLNTSQQKREQKKRGIDKDRLAEQKTIDVLKFNDSLREHTETVTPTRILEDVTFTDNMSTETKNLSATTETDSLEKIEDKPTSIPHSIDTLVSQTCLQHHVENKDSIANIANTCAEDDLSFMSGNEGFSHRDEEIKQSNFHAGVDDDEEIKPNARLLQPEKLAEAIPTPTVESVTTSSSANSKLEYGTTPQQAEETSAPDMKQKVEEEAANTYQPIDMPHLVLGRNINARSFINGPVPDSMLGQAARSRQQLRPDSHEAYVKSLTETSRTPKQHRMINLTEWNKQEQKRRGTPQTDAQKKIVMPPIQETNIPPAPSSSYEIHPDVETDALGAQQSVDIKKRVSGLQKKLKDAGTGFMNKAKQIPRGGSFTRVKPGSEKSTGTENVKDKGSEENSAKKVSLSPETKSVTETPSSPKSDTNTLKKATDEKANIQKSGDRSVNPLTAPMPIERKLSTAANKTNSSTKAEKNVVKDENKITNTKGKSTNKNKNRAKKTPSTEMLKISNASHSDVETLPEFVTIRRKIRRTREDGTKEVVTKKVRLRPERILPNGDVIVKRTMRVAKEDGSGGTQILTVMQVIPRRKRSSMNAKKKSIVAGSNNERGAMTDSEDVQIHLDKIEPTSMPDMGSILRGNTNVDHGFNEEGDEFRTNEQNQEQIGLDSRSLSMPIREPDEVGASEKPKIVKEEATDSGIVSRSRSAYAMGSKNGKVMIEHNKYAKVTIPAKARRASDVIGLKSGESNFYNWARNVTRRLPRGKTATNVATSSSQTAGNSSPQRNVAPLGEVEEGDGRRRGWMRKKSLPRIWSFQNRKSK